MKLKTEEKIKQKDDTHCRPNSFIRLSQLCD